MTVQFRLRFRSTELRRAQGKSCPLSVSGPEAFSITLGSGAVKTSTTDWQWPVIYLCPDKLEAMKSPHGECLLFLLWAELCLLLPQKRHVEVLIPVASECDLI